MRVLVVVARQVAMTSYHLPLGIGYVSASLKRTGHDVVVLNPNHHTEDLAFLIVRAIREHQPDVLAVGGMAFHMTQIRTTISTARSLMPHGVIVVGGALLTNQPQVAMTALPEADIGVIGEGETTSVELLAALSSGQSLDTVKGIIYRTAGKDSFKITEARPIEKDLDALPWVDYEGLGLDVYASLHGPGEMAPGLVIEPGARVLPFLTSRGCPYSCTFCCHDVGGHNYRSRSLDDTFAEMESLIERYGINTLCIFDDVFCLKRQRMAEFCERIRPLGLRWECSVRVEQVDPDTLRMMKDSGCSVIGFGVESMSPTVLNSMQKKTTREALDRALGQVYDAKMTTWANLIFGDPAETMETALDSLEWWAKNNRYDLRTAFIGYHPGSKIYSDALASGLIADPLAFLVANKPEVNATSIDDAAFEALKNRVGYYTQSFGYPGKIVDVQPGSEGTLNFSTVCPHCGLNSSYENIRPSRQLLTRLSCKGCNQLYRLPLIHRCEMTKEMERLLGRIAGQEISKENFATVNDLCTKILSLDTSYVEIWQALIYVTDLRGEHDRATAHLMKAIVNNPFYPELFEQMDERLARQGFDAERVKYARQGALLRRLGVTAPTLIVGI